MEAMAEKEIKAKETRMEEMTRGEEKAEEEKTNEEAKHLAEKQWAKPFAETVGSAAKRVTGQQNVDPRPQL